MFVSTGVWSVQCGCYSMHPHNDTSGISEARDFCPFKPHMMWLTTCELSLPFEYFILSLLTVTTCSLLWVTALSPFSVSYSIPNLGGDLIIYTLISRGHLLRVTTVSSLFLFANPILKFSEWVPKNACSFRVDSLLRVTTLSSFFCSPIQFSILDGELYRRTCWFHMDSLLRVTTLSSFL